MALVSTTHTRTAVTSVVANNGCIATFYSDTSCDIYPHGESKPPLHIPQASYVLYFEDDSKAFDNNGAFVANGVILALCAKAGQTTISAWSASSLQSLSVEITQQPPVQTPLVLPFLAALTQHPISVSTLSLSCVAASSLERFLTITTENPSCTHIYIVKWQQSAVRIKWHQVVLHKNTPFSVCLTPNHLLVSELGGISLVPLTRIQHSRSKSISKKQASDQSKKQDALFSSTNEPLFGLQYVRCNLSIAYSPTGVMYALYIGWLEKDKPILIVLKMQTPFKVRKFSLYHNVKLDPQNPAMVVSLFKDNEVCLFPLKEVLKAALQQENDIIAGDKAASDLAITLTNKLLLLSEPACDVSCGNDHIIVASKQELFVYAM